MSKNSDVVDIYKSVVMPTYTPSVALMTGTLVTLWYSYRSKTGVAQLRWLKWKLD